MKSSPKNLPQTILYFKNNTADPIKEYLEISGHYALSFKLIDLANKINTLCPHVSKDFTDFNCKFGPINLGLKLFFDNSQSKAFIDLGKEEIEPSSLFFKQLLYHTLDMTSEPTTNNEKIYNYFSAVVDEIKVENIMDQLTAIFVTQNKIKLKQFLLDILEKLYLSPSDQKALESLTICHNFVKTLYKNYPQNTLFELTLSITEYFLSQIDDIKEKNSILKKVLDSMDIIGLSEKTTFRFKSCC